MATAGIHGFSPALTSFVGRAVQVGEMARLLDDFRLVTITGPGGVGKTRLAAEVARRVGARFADDVWLVELAAVQEPDLVAAWVITALGIELNPGKSPLDMLTAALARRQLLLVMDNCEHVIGAVGDLCGSLLLAADDVRILATSREPVGVSGEARYRLSPLTLPGGEADANGSEAIALFADRARQVDPHFTLDRETGALAARLVAGLDGIPLAIELAAARVETLGVAQLVERLDDRFGLLVGGDRRSAARQRSLVAAVDWSYQLLSGDERRVFRQMSIFPAPFTLDAAEAVAGAGTAPVVLHLVDCSMLAPPRAGPDGRARYAMLETLRAFAADRLAESGEDPAAALAAFMLGVAVAAASELETGPGELAAGRLLDAEDHTMRQALTWALEHDRETALRLAVALAPWWVLRGRYAVGYELLGAAAGSAATGRPEWCAAQFWLGRLARIYTVGLEHFTAVRDALAGRGASRLLVGALSERAICLMNLDRIPEAATQARRALELARELDYPAGQARALYVLGGVAGYAGDPETMLTWLRQTQQFGPATLPGYLIRRCAIGLAIGLDEVGELAEAQQQCAQVLALAREAGDLRDQADCLQLMTRLALKEGRISEAGAYLREGVEIGVRMGRDFILIDFLDKCGHMCSRMEHHADALTAWCAQAALLKASGLLDLPEEAELRQRPLRLGRQVLGPDRARAAEERGAAMGLATAAEYMLMLTTPQKPHGAPDLPQLSARERELVILVAEGRTDAQIAQQLFISIRTVRSHLDRIRDKSGYRRRADLTRLALQTGLV